MPRITSVYKRQAAPRDVAVWEHQVNTAESDAAALVQLTYHLALEVRTVKLLLIWTLVIIPAVAAVALFVLPELLRNAGTSPF